MLRLTWIVAGLLVLGCQTIMMPTATAGDWPWWRGPNFNGIAEEGQTPPTKWNSSQNVVWQTPVPGRGHSSPIVVGDKVVLTTADEGAQVQSVIAYNRKTGGQLWKTDVLKGNFLKQIHKKNTHASATPAWDGERLFVAFANNDSVYLTALDINGNQLWQKRAGGFLPDKYKYGYAPSPVIYKDKVIVAAEYESGGYIKAFDRRNGKELWEIPRPILSFSSPVIANLDGKDYLLITGGDFLAGYDPDTGKGVWRAQGCSIATCGTVVWEGDMVFGSGGYPQKNTVGVQVRNGQARQLWSNDKVKCYEQSMLAHDGHLYGVDDTGIAYCWDAKTGREIWKARVGGPVSASLTLAGGNLYYSDERGTTYVFKATPEKFTPIARNTLGDESFATPTIADNQIFLRHADSSSGVRKETLYCIGE